jgi:hypothetical protein
MVRTTWEIGDKSESFLKALGKITSRYALLEELIIGNINILVGGDCASIVTAGLPFSRSLTILGAIYRQQNNLEENDEYPPLLKKLLTQSEKAEEERNKIIHSMWQNTHIRGALIRTKHNISRKKGLKIDREIVSPANLNDVADVIQNAVELALNFMQDILRKYVLTLITPPDAALVDSKPKFSWLPIEGAIGYELIISEKTDFSEPNIFKSSFSPIKGTTYTCEIPLHQNKTYYWRILPIIGTERGYWSEVRRFTVQ